MLGRKAILFALLIGVSICVSGFGEAENLLRMRNPGFEEGTTWWDRGYIPAAGLEMICEEGVAYSGDRSIAIKNTHVYDDFPRYNNWTQRIQGRATFLGEALNLSVFMKTEDAENAYCVLVCYNNDWGILAVDNSAYVVGTTDWTVHRTGVVVPAGTTKVVVMLGLKGTGKVWYDDVSLMVGDVVVKDEAPPVTATAQTEEVERDIEGNLLTNPDLEAGTTGWIQGETPAAGLEMVCEEGTAYSGNRCLAIKNTHVYDEPTLNEWIQIIEGHTVTNLVGQSVNLSVFIRTEDAEFAQCTLICYTNNFEVPAVDRTSPIVGTTAWTVYNMGFVVPEGTTRIFLHMGLNGTGKVWFDDVSLAVGDVVVKDEAPPVTATAQTEEVERDIEGNLLTNPDLEAGTTGWNQGKTPAAGLEMVCETGVAYSGARSLAIKNTHIYDEWTWNNWVQTITGHIVTDLEGQIVNLSVFVKTEEAEYVQCTILCMNDSYETLAMEYSPLVSGTTDWAVHRTGLVVPEGTTQIHVYLALSGTGKVWFDDASLAIGDVVVKDEETSVTGAQAQEAYEQPSLGSIYGLGRLQEPTLPLAEKEWTILFYDDADFHGYNAAPSFSEEVYSTNNINVLVLEDLASGPANTWYLPEYDWPMRVQENGEVNMGAYETLRDFLAFAKQWYPAKRYILLLYDHGLGWRGACRDDTTDPTKNEWLTPDEMQRALAETGGVDLIAFTGPCLMGAIETAYELRDCTDVYLGSEETSGYAHWMDALGSAHTRLDRDPDMSTVVLGELLMDFIEAYYPEHRSKWSTLSLITMSAIRTDRLPALTEAVDRFAEALLEHLGGGDATAIAEARERTQAFGFEGYTIDLCDFAEHCSELPSLEAAASQVVECLEACVIAEYHDPAHSGAHGLTVYFPSPPPGGNQRGAIFDKLYYSYRTEYPQTGLDFTEDTDWDEFLETYFDLRD